MGAGYSPVAELNLLKELQDEVGRMYLADGFELLEYGDDSGLRAGWSKDPEFLGRLIPFAQANGSGSFYAFWRVDDRAELGTLPVVVFGDEGGQYVVARDVREFLRLLALDTEVTVAFDEAYFYLDPDEDEHSDGHEAYVAWLGERFGLTVPEDADAVVAAAEAKYGKRFAEWCGRYFEV